MLQMHGHLEFALFARAAHRASAELPKEMRKGIAKIGTPARRAIRKSARTRMPKRGGYAATLGKSIRVTVRTDTRIGQAGVTIRTYAVGKKERRDLPSLNEGRLRHPVYGHRKRRWVTQRVPPKFWDDAIDEVSDVAERQFAEALNATMNKLKG